jgi:DNA-binding beta-propeller fold protein YncE
MLAVARRPRTLLALLAALLLTVVPVTEAAARGGPAVGDRFGLDRVAPPGTPGSPARPDAQRGGPPWTPPGLARDGGHEVWALDQGTDLVHVLDSRRNLREVAVIDLGAQKLVASGFGDALLEAFAAEHEGEVLGRRIVPHMIEFDSDHRYAFIAATAGGVTIVIDARSKEVVEVLPTGPASHMAAVTPDDSAVWVSVIGSTEPGRERTQAMVEIPLGDLDEPDPVFAIGTRLVVEDVLGDHLEEEGLDWEFRGFQPVCHQFTPDSREAWVTLGPQWDRGGLFVLDLDTHEVTAAWDPTEVRANCGIGVNPEGTRVVANWSGVVVEGGDTEGEWYVFDARTKALLRTESARGLDAHGVRFSPDGRELWAVNRNSGNGLVIDAGTFRVTDEIGQIWDTPDILDFSPDGEVVYVTQRGPAPRSGAVHAAAGDSPGLTFVDTATRTVIGMFEPPTVKDTNGVVQNDLHGVGVRPVVTGERLPGPSARALVRRAAVVPVWDPQPGSFGCHLPPG